MGEDHPIPMEVDDDSPPEIANLRVPLHGDYSNLGLQQVSPSNFQSAPSTDYTNYSTSPNYMQQIAGNAQKNSATQHGDYSNMGPQQVSPSNIQSAPSTDYTNYSASPNYMQQIAGSAQENNAPQQGDYSSMGPQQVSPSNIQSAPSTDYTNYSASPNYMQQITGSAQENSYYNEEYEECGGKIWPKSALSLMKDLLMETFPKVSSGIRDGLFNMLKTDARHPIGDFSKEYWNGFINGLASQVELLFNKLEEATGEMAVYLEFLIQKIPSEEVNIENMDEFAGNYTFILQQFGGHLQQVLQTLDRKQPWEVINKLEEIVEHLKQLIAEVVFCHANVYEDIKKLVVNQAAQ